MSNGNELNRTIFVFGSNLAGRHGKGAAFYARQHHGAEYGVGEGLTGDSYALPTKGRNLETRSLSEIQDSLHTLAHHACKNPAFEYALTPIGCGLAGYKQEQIIELVRNVNMPSNVYFTAQWKPEIIRRYYDPID